MFSGNVNDTSRVIRMTIVGDATAYSFTPDDSRGVTYDLNILYNKGHWFGMGLV